MGLMYSAYIKNPDTTPNIHADSTFDPFYGFPNGRKERVMQATEAEMEAAGLAPDERDFCAHKKIAFLTCRKEHFPWVVACKPEKHFYEKCEFEDYVLRMKEFERERRLLEREKRKGRLAEHRKSIAE